MLFLHSLKFKEVQGPQILVGPEISQGKDHVFELDNTKFNICIPRSNTKVSAESRTWTGKFQSENVSFELARTGKPEWNAYVPLTRHWDFFGPKFTGKFGNVTLSLGIIRPKNEGNTTSAFHPRAFEFFMGDYLTYSFADVMQQGSPQWKAPFKWEPVLVGGIQGVKFSIEHANGYQGTRYRCMACPIADKQILYLEARLFSHTVSSTDGENTIHDMASMDKLIDDIFDSVKVDLSPEAAAQQEAAMEGLEDRSLVKEYPPLKWDKTDLQVL